MKRNKKPKVEKNTHQHLPNFETMMQDNELPFLEPDEDMNDDEEDEFLADSNLSLGRSISKGIPWSKFSEQEIQGILKTHFEKLGFNVVWRHRDDPANEGGIDLECIREDGSIRIIVAVKKKPKKESLAQVVELSDEQANQRIYVYVNGASQSFRNKIPRFKQTVEFWDEKRIETELKKTGMTLWLKIDNSPANSAIHKIILSVIEAIITKQPHNTSLKPTVEIMETIWAMKDRAVTVYKCSNMAQLMCEDPHRFGKLDYDAVQNIIVWTLDYIYVKSLLSLKNIFNDLSPELKKILNDIYKKTKGRSNWPMLLTYNLGFKSGEVISTISEYEQKKTDWKELDINVEKKIKNSRIFQFEWTRLDEAADEFRRLSIWAYGLESTIDDLYKKCISGQVQS